MLTVAIPFLVAVLGLILYLASSTKVAELGRLMFLAGILVTLYELGGRHFHVS